MFCLVDFARFVQLSLFGFALQWICCWVGLICGLGFGWRYVLVEICFVDGSLVLLA